MQALLTIVPLLVFPLLMAFAASSDLLTMRISNRVVLLTIFGFFALALVVGLPLEVIGTHLACAGIVLVVAFSFFAFGWIGGGDAKLAAATTLWLDRLHNSKSGVPYGIALAAAGLLVYPDSIIFQHFMV